MRCWKAVLFSLVMLLLCALVWWSCADDECEGSDESADDDDDDGAPGDDDTDFRSEGEGSQGLQRDRLEGMFEKMGFLPYTAIQPVRNEPASNGYTRYYFSIDDLKCYDGSEANVAVSPGTVDNVLFFQEGGGASWPGYFLGFEIDFLRDIGFKNRNEGNPLKDWHFVYVPYCDNSVHSGDAETTEFGRTVYHQGLRHTAASAALARELFPNAKKVLVSGASAGGFGTLLGWAIVKSQFMDAKTYVMDDSGVGFWNPERPDTWKVLKESWNLRIPDDCEKCDSPIQTWLFDLYMDYDPQVRIGIFSSYHDFVISRMFLRMDANAFETLLMSVTNEIKAAHPKRFGRFFIQGNTHTCYWPLLPRGANTEVDGLSLYDWIDQLVNDSTGWDDRLE